MNTLTMTPQEAKQLFDTLQLAAQTAAAAVLTLLFLKLTRYSPKGLPLSVEHRKEAEKAAKKNLTLLLTAGATIALMTPISWLTGKYSSLIFTTIVCILTAYWIYEANHSSEGDKQ